MSGQLPPASIRLSVMLCSALFLVASCVLIPSAASQKLRVVACEGSVAQLKCGDGEVISVSSATYGRTDQTTCAAGRPANQITNVRCSRSFSIDPFGHFGEPLHPHKVFGKVAHIFGGHQEKNNVDVGHSPHLSQGSSSDKVAESCNGKQNCSITAANSVFGDPCVGTYKYLEVDYTCEYSGRKPQRGPTVACEGSVAQLQCGDGEVISVSSATYGRSDQTTCAAGRPANQITNVRCSRSFGLHKLFGVQGKGSSSNKVAESCNGKQNCSITAANSVFGDPCVGTYKYLEVDYTCEHPGRKPQSGPTVACEGSVAQLQCDKGEVIHVTNSTYGRRDQKTCAAGRPANQITNVQCSTSSDRVGESCNGKQRCNVSASNLMFGDPCVGTYKYLEVEYICYAFLTG